MRFVETDIFGVYLAPIVPMMAVAFALTLLVRRIAIAFGWFRWLWHPALFEFSIYLLLLSAVVLTVSAFGLHV